MALRMAILPLEPGAVPVFTTLLIDAFANGLFIPLSMLYLASASGVGISEVGVLLSVSGAVAIPVPLWIGILVDTFGARDIVMASQLVQAIGFVGYFLVSGPSMLVAMAVTVTLGQRTFWSSIFTLLSGLSSGETDARARDRWFAVVAMLRAVGYGVGAIVAGWAITNASQGAYQALVLVNGLFFVWGAILVGMVPRDLVVPRGRQSRRLRGYDALRADRPYQMLIGLNSVFALCNVFLGIALPVYVAVSLPSLKWLIGPLLAMNTVVIALGQIFAAHMLRRVSRGFALALAGGLWTLWSLASALILYLPHGFMIPYLVGVTLCYSAAFIIHTPVSGALAVEAVPEDVRGRYLAAFQLSFSVATVVAPMLFSVLFGHGRPLPWLVLSVLAASATMGVIILTRHLPGEAVQGIRSGPAPLNR